MSFLLDPPLLYAQGRAYAEAGGPDGKPAAALGAASMALFWGISGALYFNHDSVKPLWKLCRADNGRDWMLNSGVLKLDHRNAGPKTHAVSALLFASYPFWLYKGYSDGRR